MGLVLISSYVHPLLHLEWQHFYILGFSTLISSDQSIFHMGFGLYIRHFDK